MRQLLLREKNTPRRFPAGAVTGLFFLALLALASPASAAYQQLPPPNGIFGGSAELVKEGNFSEEVQLGGTAGLAVNRTGADGVPAGTVYAVTDAAGGGGVPRVAMFEPKAGGGLEFAESWQVSREGAYERCGPLLGTEEVGGKTVTKHPCPTRSEGPRGALGIDVDRSTGYVYVYGDFSAYKRVGQSEEFIPGVDQIVSYRADGSEVIARFGEQARISSVETLAESPEKVHTTFAPSALVVNSSGEVYVDDEQNLSGNFYHRLMVFRPHNGDYTDYEYAGEVAAGVDAERAPQAPVFDEGGNLYVAGITGGTSAIEALPHETPGPYPNPQQPALCSYRYPQAGVKAMTVDPETGDVFFFSERAPIRVRRLGPCDHATGKFAEEASPEAITLSPEPESIYGLAFDPDRQADPSRPPGMLYAASPAPSLATPGNPTEKSALGYILAHPQEVPPKVKAESFGHVGTTGALAEASIDPEGFPTRYVFQYETEEQYEANDPIDRFAGASEAPVGGALLGEGSDPISATAALSGLQPDTAYRFRAVATSHCSSGEPAKVCEATGEALSFRTYPLELPGLPDRRAYELVSPVDKNGGQVFPADPSLGTCASLSGECKPGFSTGTRIAMQSAPDGESIAYQGTPFSLEEGYVKTDQYIARRDSKAGWQSTNLTPTQSKSVHSSTFSTSLDQAVLGPQVGLSPEAPAGYQDLYLQPSDEPAELTPLLGKTQSFHRTASEFEIRFAGASEDLSRVFFEANDALTEATPFVPEAVDGGKTKFNLYDWHEGQVSLVNALPGNTTTQPGVSLGASSAHGISKDGSHVFFSDKTGQVYLRENGETTKEIAIAGTPDPGKFLAAAVDGSAVLLTNGHLHYTEGAEETIDLTQGKGGFEGMAGQSEDLSSAYFVDTKVLDDTPNAQSEEAEDGKFNLYAWAQGEGTRFIASLSAGDNVIGAAADWTPMPGSRTAEASPSGRWLAFLSLARLTGYDNTGAVCGHVRSGPPPVYGPGPCEEAFLYDSATGKLVCASCNPSGEQPLGKSVLRVFRGGVSDAPPTLPQPRYLTDEGRLFFDSRDSIVLGDTNNGVEDVYEFEPNGVGSCERKAGCIRLISAGTGVNDSNFLAMDPTGKNAFFTTRDQLTLKDKDQLIDLYDAREGGGIAAETEVARTECQGEACQTPVSPPNDQTPGSSTFEGAGNVKEAKAKKHAKKHKKKHIKNKHANKRAAKHNRGGAK